MLHLVLQAFCSARKYIPTSPRAVWPRPASFFWVKSGFIFQRNGAVWRNCGDVGSHPPLFLRIVLLLAHRHFAVADTR